MLNNNANNVKMKLEEIKVDSFPDAFLTKTEIKNTKAFVDYLNKLENLDKEVWKLFSNFNKLDTIPSNIPFQIKHTAGHKLNVVHYANSLELDSVNLIKLLKEDKLDMCDKLDEIIINMKGKIKQ